MVDHRRSSDSQYENGQYSPGRGQPADPPTSVWRTGAQPSIWSAPPPEEAWPESQPAPMPAPTGQMPTARRRGAQPRGPRSREVQPPDARGSELPPPEWADPAMGRRWTTSWRVRPTGAQASLPQERPAPPQGRRDTGSWPAAPYPTEQQPPWEGGASPRIT